MEIDEQRHRAVRTMRALVQHSHRGPEDLRHRTDHRRPVPGPGEYLIRVGAAGVNFADVMQSRGTYRGGPLAPYVAGFEAAGEIVGSDRRSRVPSRSAPKSSGPAQAPSRST